LKKSKESGTQFLKYPSVAQTMGTINV